LSFLVTCYDLEYLGLFLLRRLGGAFFGIVVDSSIIALVPSGDDATLSSGLLNAIVGVGSVVFRRVQGFLYLGLS
jgi:hypothetical protein